MVIEQEIKLIRVFNTIILILRVISSFMYLFFAAFRTPNLSFEAFNAISAIVELLFLFDMILNFFRSYTPDETTIPVYDFAIIASNYLTG